MVKPFMWDKIKELIKQVIAKVVAVGGTIVISIGTYTVTIVISDTVGFKISEEIVDSLVKAALSLLAGYGIWLNGVVPIIEGKTETFAAEKKRKPYLALI